MLTITHAEFKAIFEATQAVYNLSEVPISKLATQLNCTEADVLRYKMLHPTTVVMRETGAGNEVTIVYVLAEGATLEATTNLTVGTTPTLALLLVGDTFTANAGTYAKWTVPVACGLTLSGATKVNANTVILSFTGTCTAGTLSITGSADCFTSGLVPTALLVPTTASTLVDTTSAQDVSNKTFDNLKIKPSSGASPKLATAVQAGAAPVITFPDVGAGNVDTVMTLGTAQAVTGAKTFDSLIVNGLVCSVEAGLVLSADITLSAAQIKKTILEVTTGHDTYAIIAPATTGKSFLVVNNSTLGVNFKKAAGTAIVIPPKCSMWVYYNGTQYAFATNMPPAVLVIASIAADKTLSAAEAASNIIAVTAVTSPFGIIAPAVLGRTYDVVNNSATVACTFKAVGGSAPVSIPAARTRRVYCTGTEYVIMNFLS